MSEKYFTVIMYFWSDF